MRMAVIDHVGPWSEEEYFALGETSNRVELIDGGLWVSPAPSKPQQELSFLLVSVLRPGARAAVSGSTRRSMCGCPPDVWSSRISSWRTPVRRGPLPTPRKWCSCATSSRRATLPRTGVLKMQLYAAARIGWYLLVEPDLADFGSVTLRLFRLDGEHYVEQGVATPGGTLDRDEPFTFRIDTGALGD